ncbi:MAG TPA: PhzF family phenazine biosynthesis protein [Thermoanaerobaculaceae bacterium]|nr:PhzF family phenazine biosynthesis protein [Thermoanaerobaculaceae bacterium]HRS15258.1 PhzF family phenazine biosynthesis protein [Thermoanaerobaculaceae bacterium]
MPQSYTIVDAFTNRPFAGNPAAVVVLPEPWEVGRMQLVAREFNLSETAFLVRRADGFDLRWFTPEVEVELCGHATLASAHVLWSEGHLAEGETARFHTESGLLQASRRGEWIELDFPARAQTLAEPPAGLVEALGVRAVHIGRWHDDWLVELASEVEVRQARPDHTRLAAVGVRGAMITAAAATPGLDFVSRFFVPGAGIAEDPVTGSAHCCLTPYWAGRLGRAEMTAFQASARGGELRVRLDGKRVRIAGHAVTVARGKLVA